MKYLLSASAVSALLAGPAMAATFDITGTISNGIFAGISGSGTITFDETLLTGVGDESLVPVGSTTLGAIEDSTLDIIFDVGPEIFTAMNDVDFPDFPSFDFLDGALTFIDYVVVDGESGADLAPYGVLSGSFSDDLFFDDAEQSFFVSIDLEYDVSPVPLPAGLPMLLVGLGAFGYLRQRKS